MQRACDACGGSYEAKRSTSKYCGTACQKRGQRGQVIVTLPVAEPAGLLSAVAETRAELVAADRLRGHLAASALHLAKKIDEAPTAVGYAPLVAQLRDVMVQALAGAAKATTRIDELKAKRDAKRAG